MTALCFGWMTFTTALFDFIGSYFKDVPCGLRDADLLQLRPFARKSGGPVAFQAPADLAPQVFRGRHRIPENLCLRVQVAVVERNQHLLAHQAVERPDVYRPPARRQWPPGTHFHLVI